MDAWSLKEERDALQVYNGKEYGHVFCEMYKDGKGAVFIVPEDAQEENVKQAMLLSLMERGWPCEIIGGKLHLDPDGVITGTKTRSRLSIDCTGLQRMVMWVLITWVSFALLALFHINPFVSMLASVSAGCVLSDWLSKTK